MGLRFAGIHTGGFFLLECGKKALCHGVIPAISFTAHALHEASFRDHAAKTATGVLPASIRVKNHTVINWRFSPGVHERLLYQALGHTVRQAVTQHLPGLDTQPGESKYT